MLKLFSHHRSRFIETKNSFHRFASNLKTDKCWKHDSIGPPDPVSNLRPVIITEKKNETSLERRYREARERTQNWNQNFWTAHNCSFVKERKEFQNALKEASGKDSVTADEMSVFYKRFLDKNWAAHCKYNVSWYKQNITILMLEIRVRLSKIKFK